MKKIYRNILMAVVSLLAAGTPLLASETDDRIQSAFEESYVFKTYLKNDSVKAESLDGAVTLSGTVEQDSHKSLAQETMANLPGVKSIDNRLELKGEHPAEDSNEWTALKVKTTLMFHTSVNTAKTEVYVEEGVVTLRGEAESAAQRELITEYVKDVSGIEGVKNEMTIAPAVKTQEQTEAGMIDDASVTAQVKVVLKYRNSIIVHASEVQTKDGIVTLGGKVKNDGEKALMTKLVSDIYGVKGVINNMTQNNAIDGFTRN